MTVVAPSPLAFAGRAHPTSFEVNEPELDVVVSSARLGDRVAYCLMVDGQRPVVSVQPEGSSTCDATFAAFVDRITTLPSDRTWRVGLCHTRFQVAFEPLGASWPHVDVVAIPISHPVMVVAHDTALRALSSCAAKAVPTAPQYLRRLVIATDGSSGHRASKMRGGFGWVDENGRSGSGVLRSIEPLDAEISAIIDALTKTKSSRRLKFLVDSSFAIEVAEAAAAGRPASPRRGLGAGLYSRLCVLMAGRDAKFKRVIGHDGHPLNEAADRISRYARRAHDMDVSTEIAEAVKAEIIAEEMCRWRGRRAAERITAATSAA